jgi:hypothetical protein
MFSFIRKIARAVPRPAGASAPASLGRMFCQKGFVQLPQVFSPEDVAAFRAAAIDVLPPAKPPYQPQSSNTALFDEPFRRVLRNDLLIRALRELLGEDFLFINEFALHDSIYAGWHSDTASPEAKGGHEFHWSPAFLMLNAAIYLQDNDDNGGGLDVVPGSHLRDDPCAITMKGGRQARGAYDDAVTIRSKAGDVVMFHLRISHRASVTKRPASNHVERKLALFLIAGANNAPTRRYRTWLDQYDGMNKVVRPSVPESFRAELNSNRLQVL